MRTHWIEKSRHNLGIGIAARAAVIVLTASAAACDDAARSVAGPEDSAGQAFHRSDTRNRRARNRAIVALPFFVRDGAGDPVNPENPEVLLHEAVLGQPITAPDGHQVTWGEWSAVKGRVFVKCTRSGTRSVLRLSGLIPRGKYTVWNVTFQPPGFTGEFIVPGSIPANVIGFGPAGPNDGRRSSFRASARGRARISTITPAGPLGSVGEIGACALTDEFEWHIVGLYHSDGETHGPVRGPEGTRAEQFAFIFRTARDGADSGQSFE